MLIFIPSSFIKSFSLCASGRAVPVSHGVANVAGSLFAHQSAWLHPHPASEKELLDLRGAPALLCIPRAQHITFPSLSFSS